MYEEYPEVYFPEHHRAKKNGCVDRHIIEAEKNDRERAERRRGCSPYRRRSF